MRKYRGFVGQVTPLSGLGYIRNGRQTGYYSERTRLTTNKITPTLPPTEAAPILEPERFEIDLPPIDWSQVIVNGRGPWLSPAEQEIEARQYREGGDGTATEIERTAKIDEAMQRLKEQTVGFEPWLTPGTPEQAARIAAQKAAAEKPNLLPLVIGAGLIWLMS